MIFGLMILIGFTGKGAGTAIGLIFLLDLGTSLMISGGFISPGFSFGFSADLAGAGSESSAAGTVYNPGPRPAAEAERVSSTAPQHKHRKIANLPIGYKNNRFLPAITSKNPSVFEIRKSRGLPRPRYGCSL